MKNQVLLDNAYEAWTAAIRYCDNIFTGKCTLQYQKFFVSSLHNAVELYLKQMMLNDNNHEIAFISKVKSEESAKLQLEYFQSKNLNAFFCNLSDAQLRSFKTAEFSWLVDKYKKITKVSSQAFPNLKEQLALLQKLRNNETHFLIREGDFLSEQDFCILHNFMIDFYKIISEWEPLEGTDEYSFLLPYWGEPIEDDAIYSFERKPISSFSYKDAVENAPMVKKLIIILSGDWLYGAPDFSPYSIAKEIVQQNVDLEDDFNEVWTCVYLMQIYKMIEVEEIFDEVSDNDPPEYTPMIHYTMTVKL